MTPQKELTMDLLPDGVAQSLQEFLEGAKTALGPSLHSVTLFGSGAEGRLRSTSDLNLLVVLHLFEQPEMDALREPMRLLETLHRGRFMLLLVEELPAALEAFPDKFQDLLRRHHLLFGADPLAGLKVDPLRLRQKISQSFLNQALRLRETYALRSLREEQAEKALAEAAGPMRAQAANLLALEGELLAPKAALARLAETLPGGPWEDLLAALSLVREGEPLAPGRAPELLFCLTALAQQLHRRSLEVRA